jgi:plasmid stabilization system protein ParE
MKVRWLSVAESDFSEALDYYLNDAQSPMAASDFADEVDHALDAIRNSPLTFPEFEGEVRVKLLRRFPYSILYLVEESEIILHSIIQQERMPGYWKHRL